MDKVSLNIKIGDRTYPLKVEAEEVERLKKSGKVLNTKIKEYQAKFGIDDMQDLLAMVAFDAFISANQSSSNLNHSHQNISNRLTELSELIDSLHL